PLWVGGRRARDGDGIRLWERVRSMPTRIGREVPPEGLGRPVATIDLGQPWRQPWLSLHYVWEQLRHPPAIGVIMGPPPGGAVDGHHRAQGYHHIRDQHCPSLLPLFH